ncbi:MAG: hypothetical protein JW967_01690 [Dehalococcoidales bacterium]|nr:hypothetical protein [Dehalococcoidales bacterium]
MRPENYDTIIFHDSKNQARDIATNSYFVLGIFENIPGKYRIAGTRVFQQEFPLELIIKFVNMAQLTIDQLKAELIIRYAPDISNGDPSNNKN